MTDGQYEVIEGSKRVVASRSAGKFAVAMRRTLGLLLDVLTLAYFYATVRLLLLQFHFAKHLALENPGKRVLYLPWALVLGLAIVIAFLWGSTFTSLGKRLLNTTYARKGKRKIAFGRRLAHGLLNVIGSSSALLGLASLHTRNPAYKTAALATLPLLVLFLWALVDRKGQTLPDKVTGIIVSVPEMKEIEDVGVRPPPWYTRSWGAFAVALLILSYVTGWVITKIDLPAFVKDAANAKPLLLDLVRPDLFERTPTEEKARAKFQIPCSDEPPLPKAVEPGVPSVIILGDTCGEIGDVITVRGENFTPSARGTLFWVDPIGMEQRIRPILVEDDGTFEFTFAVPQARGAEHEIHGIEADVSVPSGPWRATKTLRMVIDKMIETIFLALMATTLGVIIAIPVSFLSARNLMIGNPLSATVYYVTRTIMNILRSIEPLIWALIFVVWVGIGPFAGVLALSLHTIAALGKLYSEAIESIDPGPIEAVTATGATRVQTIVYAVIPQMIPPFVAFTIYRWDINVRMSTVIGLVGGGGIGFLLIQWINLLQYRQAATAVWAIALVVAIMDYTSAIVRERLV